MSGHVETRDEDDVAREAIDALIQVRAQVDAVRRSVDAGEPFDAATRLDAMLAIVASLERVVRDLERA